MRIPAALVLAIVLSAAPADAAPSKPPPPILLITLDTTRADYVGVGRSGPGASTPNLDALGRSGVAFANALTPSPLTLPAHCSLMTGLNPPAHGVRDNGVASLPADLPTLAAVLSRRGYATGAIVASRVLDRRFGLARGFDSYDDFMVEENVGEQGYPERDAAAVTTAALAWAAKVPPGKPWFLWVHYYDAHAPYEPPGDWRGVPADRRYAGEIEFVDKEVGRLLAGLPGAGRRIVAAAGDHGEMLGEHGEKEHGVFLYKGALSVPLVVSGPGVPAGRTVDAPAPTRALAASLLQFAGLGADAGPFGPGLPGLEAGKPRGDPLPVPPVYSETDMPASAYGWSPLAAATDGRFRLIVAPRPELYDLAADPSESRNLWGTEADAVRRLQKTIAEANQAGRKGAPAPESSELAASLRQLGYLSGSTGRAGTIDPKDGIRMLDELEKAKELTRQGKPREAAQRLEDLAKRSPGNVPFLVRLAEAQAAAGDPGKAIETIGEALTLNPGLDFLHLQLARLCARARRTEDAKAAYLAALKLNPRMAPAWLGLAELANRGGPPGEELRVLREGDAAGSMSGVLFARLAQIELPLGDLAAAQRHAAAAIRLLPTFAPGWWVAGEIDQKMGNSRAALQKFERAAHLGLEDPRALVHLGDLLIREGRKADARPYLERAAVIGAGTPSAEDALRLLAEAR